MSDFTPTHTIVIKHSGGQTEKIPVLADGWPRPVGGPVGPLYTEAEWTAQASADWEYDDEDGLTFKGQSGGPYNFAEYELREVGA